MRKAIMIAGVLLAVGASQAKANIIFTLGNHPVNEENILFGAPETGATITGYTNTTNVPVTFSTLTGQTLYQKSQGQADILSSSSLPSSALTSLDITIAPGYGFNDFIMNPLNGTGTATVTVVGFPGAVFAYSLGSGQNYLTINSDGGDLMREIQITMSNGDDFQQFKQPRISGVTVVTEVPEPATLALLGGGLIGIIFLRRRCRRA